MVYPSGLAVIMADAPKMPPAPGLFSHTTDTPKMRLALSAKARNTASLGPAGVHGTIRVIGLLGNLSCASALALISAGAVKLAIAAARPCKVCRRFALGDFLSMVVSFFDLYCVAVLIFQTQLVSKSRYTCLRTSQDERMDIVCAFVSVDHLEVDQMAGHAKLIADTVATHHVTRHAGNV